MADLFGRVDQIYAGGLSSDASYMFWTALPSGGLGLLINQVQIQYQQPVRRIFEIGPWIQTYGPVASGAYAIGQPVYYVAGRPEGTASIARIAGPTAVLSSAGGTSFYATYGSVCNVNNNIMFVSGSGCIQGTTSPTPDTSALTATPSAPAGAAGVSQFGAGVGSPATPFGLAGVGVRIDPFLGWYMRGVTLTNVGLSVQSQDMMVNESVQFMFVGLNLYYAVPPTVAWNQA